MWDVIDNMYSTWNWNTMQLVWCAKPGVWKTDEWCKYASISMLIETCPKTNHQKLVSKWEKEVGLEDMHHTHTHTYLQHCPLGGGSE